MYRIVWANVDTYNGHRYVTRRMCRAERRVSFFGLFYVWWPVMDGRWRDREIDAEFDIVDDKGLRSPLPAPKVYGDDD